MKITKAPKIAGLFFVGALTAFSFGAYGQTSNKTVKGEVLDMSCYITRNATGKGHQMCAQGCLNKGLPAGLLTSDGQVYLLVEDHQHSDAYKTTIKHAADDVKITGKVVKKGGVQSIVVEKVQVL